MISMGSFERGGLEHCSACDPGGKYGYSRPCPNHLKTIDPAVHRRHLSEVNRKIGEMVHQISDLQHEQDKLIVEARVTMEELRDIAATNGKTVVTSVEWRDALGDWDPRGGKPPPGGWEKFIGNDDFYHFVTDRDMQSSGHHWLIPDADWDAWEGQRKIPRKSQSEPSDDDPMREFRQASAK